MDMFSSLKFSYNNLYLLTTGELISHELGGVQFLNVLASQTANSGIYIFLVGHLPQVRRSLDKSSLNSGVSQS
jgi:hypothetical protein